VTNGAITRKSSNRNFLLAALVVAWSAMLAVAWNSAAASQREARAQSGSIVVAGAGLPTATGIYRRYPNGRLQQLTTTGEHAPAWSRDGRRIALIRHEIAKGPDVCPLLVMNSDGSDLHQVGQVRTDCSGVSWGPGDRRIVFGGGRPGRINDGLWVVNVDGSGLKRLLGGRGATEGIHPAWSPDGRTIIFGWTGRSRHPWGRLAAVRPDGSGFHVVVGPRSAPHEDEVSLPTWARDGKRLAYIRVDHRSGHVRRTLEVADARGHHRRMLVRLPIGPARSGAPAWSPNGRSIAFWSLCPQACVSTIPSRGGTRHVLMRGYIEPAWGPLGT
jgi:dipeptidyl aminopeptidase/acylaminoacyl peptidase